MSEIIQRVARRIAGALASHLGSGGQLTNDAFDHAAREALHELREPTEAMLNADMMLGGYGYGDDCYSANPKEIWQAMIDEALK